MRRGFTLIEVLTVIAIIGILASLGAYTYATSLTRSRDSQRVADLQFIRNGLEQFYVDNRSYPMYQETPDLPQATWQLEKGYSCQSKPSNQYLAPKYMSKLPNDPSNKFSLVEGNGSCTADSLGQYLYFGLPKSSSKQGFYLMALMERTQNINYSSGVSTTLVDNGYSLSSLSFCTTIEPNCSQNYFVTNSRNN
ncbi:MAG: prepilin-type N-terminal cleavage/methylation domain-containing protein [Candidatus Berkelbacteria bacterium]|nr:prepilin-type N-terminal cleavage/methylation domain-containing protein [Candidatus Berkelbacteria bacterium]